MNEALAVLRKLVHEWDSWEAGDEPLGDERLEKIVEEARSVLLADAKKGNDNGL